MIKYYFQTKEIAYLKAATKKNKLGRPKRLCNDAKFIFLLFILTLEMIFNVKQVSLYIYCKLGLCA